MFRSTADSVGFVLSLLAWACVVGLVTYNMNLITSFGGYYYWAVPGAERFALGAMAGVVAGAVFWETYRRTRKSV
jgi:hypothetical protein